MKPLLPLALLLTAAAWGAIPRATRVYINGLPLRQEAVVQNGVTYVPLRAVAESLGCTVDGACPERARGDPKAGVFVWGGQQSLTSPASRPMEPPPHRPSLPTRDRSRRSLGRGGRDPAPCQRGRGIKAVPVPICPICEICCPIPLPLEAISKSCYAIRQSFSAP
jgi:hypothetical protein